MAQQKQSMRYSDVEMSLIKATFAENDSLLKSIRKVMLQMPMDAVEQSSVVSLFRGNEGLNKLVRKTFLPELEPDAPINQEVDLWMTVQIVDKTPDVAFPHLAAREKLIEYIEQQLGVLSGMIENPKILFVDLTRLDGKSESDVYSAIVMRNTMVNHTEMQLYQLMVLAGQKQETVEETKARLMKDSTK